MSENFEKPAYEIGEEVDLTIIARTDLGYKAIINDMDEGVLYANEVFQELTRDQKIKGYIKKIRDDGKIDLRLHKPGHKAAQEDISPQILELLKENKGFFAINDKTSAEVIYRLFGVSKKKYKMALGGLYKQRLIKVDEQGIHLKN